MNASCGRLTDPNAFIRFLPSFWGQLACAAFALVKIRFVSQTCNMKKEFIFQVERDDNMLVATCHEPEMATQGENLDELIAMIRDLVQCRFDENDERLRWPIRLHFVDDPVLSLQPA